MNTEPVVLYQTTQHIASITVNRPMVRNALNDEVISKITEYCELINHDDKIRVVIIAGNGECFSAGADLKEMQQSINFSHAENVAAAQLLATMLSKLRQLTKITVCQIHGSAFGGALGMIACCDIAIAADNCKFCFSEVKLGLAPAVISPYLIPIIGINNARYWMLTGLPFNSEQAQQMGLINNAVSATQLAATVQNIAQQIADNPPQASQATKKLIATVSEAGPADKRSLEQYTTKLIADLKVSQEGQLGLTTFLAKR